MSIHRDGAGNVTPIGVRRRPVGLVSVLVLGGPWHGQRVTLPEREGSIVAPIPREPEPALTASVAELRAWADVPRPETLTYVIVKMGWHASRRVLRLLVPEKWTQAEAEHALVDWIESGA